MPDDTLTEGVRAVLGEQDAVVREVRMFGGLSFLLDERMVVAVRRDGTLLVRIDPTDHESLARQPGAVPAMMGAARLMGPGWLSVGADAVAGAGLAQWLGVALAHWERSARP